MPTLHPESRSVLLLFLEPHAVYLFFTTGGGAGGLEGQSGSGSDKVREGLVNSAWAVHT